MVMRSKRRRTRRIGNERNGEYKEKEGDEKKKQTTNFKEKNESKEILMKEKDDIKEQEMKRTDKKCKIAKTT